MTTPENEYIKIVYNQETDEIEIYSNTSYKNIFGLMEHAKMQLTCRYNKDYFEKSPDDDIFTE